MSRSDRARNVRYASARVRTVYLVFEGNIALPVVLEWLLCIARQNRQQQDGRRLMIGAERYIRRSIRPTEPIDLHGNAALPHDSNRPPIDQYLASITRRGYSKSTIATYTRILDDFLTWLDAQQLDLGTIERSDIDSFQIYLMQGPRGRPLSAGRRSLYVAVLRSFYKHCVAQASVTSAVIDWLDYPLQPKRLRQDILSLDEANALLDVAANKGGWQHIAVRLMLLSGLRAGEVAALEVGDVSLFQREIIIRQAKGNKHRLVFFDPATKRHLTSYLATRRSATDQVDLLPAAPLLEHNGLPRNTGQIYGAVKRLAKRAGIAKRISPHSLRRTFATRLLDSGTKGMNLKVVAELLGHSSLRTTAKYAQVDEQSLARIYHQAHPARKAALLA